MPQWDKGYIKGLPYIPTFQRACAPSFLTFTALLAGRRAPDPERFTALDLGCGLGFQMNLLASVHPQGRFHGVDYNRAYIEEARRAADEAGLANVTYEAASFQNMMAAPGAGPAYDFVAVNGIYSWVDEESRAALRAVLARTVRPGGIVYLSYNALPGYAHVLPLQRFLVEHARRRPDAGDAACLEALHLLDEIGRHPGSYVARHPAVGEEIRADLAKEPAFLAHEHLVLEGRAFHHAEVEADLSALGFTFIGQQDLQKSDPATQFPPAFLTRAEAAPDRVWRELLHDTLLDVRFRGDIYQRDPAGILAPEEAAARLRARAIAVASFPRALALAPRARAGAPLPPSVLDLVEARLREGARTLGELEAELPAGFGLADLLRVVAVQIDTGHLRLGRASPVDGRAARNFNRATIGQGYYRDGRVCLASPTLGSSFLCAQALALAVLTLEDRPGASAAELSAAMLGLWRDQRQPLAFGERLIADEAEARALLEELAPGILEDIAPELLRLGILADPA